MDKDIQDRIREAAPRRSVIFAAKLVWEAESSIRAKNASDTYYSDDDQKADKSRLTDEVTSLGAKLAALAEVEGATVRHITAAFRRGGIPQPGPQDPPAPPSPRPVA